jgi:hypothetical protein
MLRKTNLNGFLASACLASIIIGTGNVHAFGAFGAQVDSTCANAGNTLLQEFLPQVENNCLACHDDGNGGSGGGKTAYLAGTAAIIDYFCPTVVATPDPIPDPTCTDADGDGSFAEGGACGPLDPNDNDASVYPGAPEICDDGVDNDGNGLVDALDPACMVAMCTDLDGDGYSVEGGSCGPIDCDDSDSNINPGAEESCSDGIDNNCNGLVDNADPNAINCPIACTDTDGDGFSVEGGVCGAVDCNDSQADVNPGALEICDDNIDNNCDARVDLADLSCTSGERRDDDESEDEDEDDDDDDDESEEDDEEEEDDDGKDRD